jgi:2-oxoglutarate ferredoxin oxidoreductase subunit alpha
MSRDVFTYLVGGRAGEGVKKAASAAANHLAGMGRHVFQMDDYQSLIRGGHNFSVVSSSARPVTSQYVRADLVVALGALSYELHRGDLADGGALVRNSDAVPEGDGVGLPLSSLASRLPRSELRVGVAGPAVFAAAVGLDRAATEALVRREYPRDVENNVAYALDVHGAALPAVGGRFRLERGEGERRMVAGHEAVALGAAAAGLDAYFAYPMTPSSSLLHYLAARDRDLGIAVVHAESEIAVANMAVGAAFAGARAMVGTSGGGFALMVEALSLAGMTETPLLCMLGQRSGPSTGVPTYTEQGDLLFALHPGHGEFARVVASPGTVEEAFRLAAEMLALVWRYQAVGVLLSEKHLLESSMTARLDPMAAAWAEPLAHTGGGPYRRYALTDDGVSPLAFPPSGELIKWNSYEHDEDGITTEDAGWIARMHDKRLRKAATLRDAVRRLTAVNSIEVGRGGGPTVFTYGSTTMSVLEALRAGGINATVVQPVYLEPFPSWALEPHRGSSPVVVEQSAGGQFAALLEEKAGIRARAVVRRYDGRPFDPEELAADILKAAREGGRS